MLPFFAADDEQKEFHLLSKAAREYAVRFFAKNFDVFRSTR